MRQTSIPSWLVTFYLVMGVVFAVTWDGWLDRTLGPGWWHVGNLAFLGGAVWHAWYRRRLRDSAVMASDSKLGQE
jgi:hypothetical protein